MKQGKLEKRIAFILEEFLNLNIDFDYHILEREGKPISDYLDDDGDWNGKYHDSYEYFFWNFAVLCDDDLNVYEDKALHIRMEYDLENKTDNENGIDFIVYFSKDKTVDIVGMDYYDGSDFHYNIDKNEKFKKTLKKILSEFIEYSNSEDDKLKIKVQS